jgi:AcrR family transcriptional regulator
MIRGIKINLNEKLYLKDPEDTSLGRDILSTSVLLINELGFESFTFKKLAKKMNSTEASIYRYFENKHKLLVYLISWYWIWLEYKVELNIQNLDSAEEKLKKIIATITHSEQQHITKDTQIDTEALHKIVISEGAKSYLTKDVDLLNKEGMYADYKRLCKKIADIILSINPSYMYANALVSMLIEAANHQTFFSLHLPSLTNISRSENHHKDLNNFLEQILFSAIKNINQ